MSSRPHFRIFGVPVRIEPFFWLGAVFLAYGLGDARLIVMWVAVVLVSVIVHELGHAIALKAFGQPSSIVLHGFGGLTTSPRRLDRTRSIIVSLAGPVTALVLLGVPAYLVRESDLGADLLFDYATGDQVFGFWPVVFFAAYVNIWWSIANLLPIRPLDGGHVLTELIGIQSARIVSVVVGGGAAIWAYTHASDFQYAAFFFGFLGFINLSEYRRQQQGVRAPSAFDVDGPEPGAGPGGRRGPGRGATGGGSPPPSRPPSTGPRRAGSEPPRPHRGGRPTAPPSTPTAPSGFPGDIDPASAEPLAWNLLRRGDIAGARRVLSRSAGPVNPFAAATVRAMAGAGLDDLVAAYLTSPSGPSNLVPATAVDDLGESELVVRRLLAAGSTGIEAAKSIQTHLQYAERFASAAAVGELIHDVDVAGRAQVAFDVACACARAGDPERGLRWIARAVDEGFTAPRLLDGEPDLVEVRALPGWPDVRSRLD